MIQYMYMHGLIYVHVYHATVFGSYMYIMLLFLANMYAISNLIYVTHELLGEVDKTVQSILHGLNGLPRALEVWHQ